MSKYFIKPLEERYMDALNTKIDILYSEKNPEINAPLRFINNYWKYILTVKLLIAFLSLGMWWGIMRGGG
jgi:hypothetical protein